ncbi:hypothetical protein CPLU01_07764 [Colletotrichum plurivorum]|uniref:Uncharacterized protein n=1 Tax=Colletotrichum plurivorum TaxID=2175906 RepID=A0A8H6NDM8_9PEZI|nr:hypothetical protein CPLU01_07764 [Colletotrichum plurivorum]
MASDWKAQCFEDPGGLEPNPDIGGIGATWFSVLLVILHFLFVFDPSEDPYETGSSNEIPNRGARNPNYVDVLALKVLKVRWFRRRSRNRGKRSGILTQALLNICDAQLLTGLGILLAGFKNLADNSISAYHWQLIVYFAWFSNVTHLSCLTVLRRHFHRNQRDRRWRLLLMAVLWVGLLVAMVPTFYFNWATGEETASRQGSNARCFFDLGIATRAFYAKGCENAQAEYRDWLQDKGKEPVPDPPCPGARLNETWAFGTVILSILLAGFSFPSRAIKLVESWSIGANNVARNLLSNPTRSFIRRCMENDKVFAAFLGTQVYLVAKVYKDLLSSELSDIRNRKASRSELQDAQAVALTQADHRLDTPTVPSEEMTGATESRRSPSPAHSDDRGHHAEDPPTAVSPVPAGSPGPAEHRRPLLPTRPENEEAHDGGLEMTRIPTPSSPSNPPVMVSRVSVESPGPAEQSPENVAQLPASQPNSSSAAAEPTGQEETSGNILSAIFSYKTVDFKNFLREYIPRRQGAELDNKRIKECLDVEYEYSKELKSVMRLAFLQVILLSVFFFLHLSGALGRFSKVNALELIGVFALNILVSQPVMSMAGLLVFTYVRENSATTRYVNFWALVGICGAPMIATLSGARSGWAVWFSLVAAVGMILVLLIAPSSEVRGF